MHLMLLQTHSNAITVPKHINNYCMMIVFAITGIRRGPQHPATMVKIPDMSRNTIKNACIKIRMQQIDQTRENDQPVMPLPNEEENFQSHTHHEAK
jgi:hypothetical protein